MSILLSMVIGQSLSVQDRAKVILSTVDFEQTDVRDAVKWLFRKGLFGGTIAPDVQGTITLNLRNVPWEDALRNVLRQVDSTYRIDHGFFEIVRAESGIYDPQPFAWPSSQVKHGIEAGYRRLRYLVATGQGSKLARQLSQTILLDRFGNPSRGDSLPYRNIVERERTSRDVDIVQYTERQPSLIDVQVLYSPKETGLTKFYRDRWQQVGTGDWRLLWRRDASLSFVNTTVQDIARALSIDGTNIVVDPRIERSVSIDLTNKPFETALAMLCERAEATYSIEAGVYRVVPRS